MLASMAAPGFVQFLSRVIRPYWTEAGRRAAWNFAGLVVFTGVAQVSGLGVLLLQATNLPPAGFGSVCFALTLQSYLFLIGGAGVGAVVIRDGVQRPEHVDELTTGYFVLTGAFSTTVCVVLLGSLLFPLDGQDLAILLVVGFGNIAASMTWAPLFDMHHRQALSSAVLAVTEPAGLAATLVLAGCAALTPLTAVAVLVVKWWLIFGLSMLLFRVKVRRVRWEFRPAVLLSLLQSGWPMLLVNFLLMVPLSSGVMLVRWFRGEAETGLFGFVYQVALAHLTLLGLGLRVLYPHVVGRFGLDPGFIRKLALFGFTLCGGSALAALTLGLGVILFVLDPAYRQAIPALVLLLVATTTASVNWLLVGYLVRARDERGLLLIQAVVAALFVGGCVWLLPVTSFEVVAVLSAAANLAATVLLLLRLRGRIAVSRLEPEAAPAAGVDLRLEPAEPRP
jgi:O-antigen/teichoic acid export membrane protein